MDENALVRIDSLEKVRNKIREIWSKGPEVELKDIQALDKLHLLLDRLEAQIGNRKMTQEERDRFVRTLG